MPPEGCRNAWWGRRPGGRRGKARGCTPERAGWDAFRCSYLPAGGRGRGAQKRVLEASDRGTWRRSTGAELMRDGADPRLAATVDRAARLRSDAIQAADELASALTEAKG